MANNPQTPRFDQSQHCRPSHEPSQCLLVNILGRYRWRWLLQEIRWLLWNRWAKQTVSRRVKSRFPSYFFLGQVVLLNLLNSSGLWIVPLVGSTFLLNRWALSEITSDYIEEQFFYLSLASTTTKRVSLKSFRDLPVQTDDWFESDKLTL